MYNMFSCYYSIHVFSCIWKYSYFRYGYFVLRIEMPKVNWTSTSTADNIVAAFSLSRNGSKGTFKPGMK